MISKTKIKERKKRKTDTYIVETLSEMQKHNSWRKVAQLISSSRRSYASVNLSEIDRESKEGDTIIVPGKILGSGDLTKRVRVCAINFSDSAIEKLKKKKSEAILLVEEVKKNPSAQGVKLIR